MPPYASPLLPMATNQKMSPMEDPPETWKLDEDNSRGERGD